MAYSKGGKLRCSGAMLSLMISRHKTIILHKENFSDVEAFDVRRGSIIGFCYLTDSL
jgi:hypothetical protein